MDGSHKYIVPILTLYHLHELFSFPRDPRAGAADRFLPRDPRDRVDPRTGKHFCEVLLHNIVETWVVCNITNTHIQENWTLDF